MLTSSTDEKVRSEKGNRYTLLSTHNKRDNFRIFSAKVKESKMYTILLMSYSCYGEMAEWSEALESGS